MSDSLGSFLFGAKRKTKITPVAKRKAQTKKKCSNAQGARTWLLGHSWIPEKPRALALFFKTLRAQGLEQRRKILEP
jgi:hypothetical protein